MVMVSARLTRRWRLSYRHDLTAAAVEARAELARLEAAWQAEAADIRAELAELRAQYERTRTP